MSSISRRALLLGVCAIWLPLAGCFSFTTTHTATPLEKGETELSGGPGIVSLSSKRIPTQQLPIGASLLNAAPAFELQLRHGVAEDLGMGFELFAFGAGFDVNYAPVNTENLTISLNPSVTLSGLLLVSWGNATLDVLVDIVKTEDWTVTVGAKQGYFFVGLADVTDFMITGGTALVEWRVNEHVRIRPDVTVLYPSPNNELGTVFSQAMLGIGWQF